MQISRPNERDICVINNRRILSNLAVVLLKTVSILYHDMHNVKKVFPQQGKS